MASGRGQKRLIETRYRNYRRSYAKASIRVRPWVYMLLLGMGFGDGVSRSRVRKR